MRERAESPSDTTVSISLPPELAREVARRVATGLTASASDLVQEALRFLLSAELAPTPSPESQRLAEAFELHAAALALPRPLSGISEEEHRARIAELSLERTLHEGVRVSPERTERILRGRPENNPGG